MAITSDSGKENIVEDKLAHENFSNESASRGQTKKEIVLPRESRVKKLFCVRGNRKRKKQSKSAFFKKLISVSIVLLQRR